MKFLPLLLFLMPACAANAQNLIKSGSFEQHEPISCLGCNTLYGQYARLELYKAP